MIEVTKSGHRFTLSCDVMPLVRMSLWCAQAGHLLSELRAAEALSPQFAATVKTMLGNVARPDPTGPDEMLADVLFIAEAMLATYVENEGGDV